MKTWLVTNGEQLPFEVRQYVPGVEPDIEDFLQYCRDNGWTVWEKTSGNE